MRITDDNLHGRVVLTADGIALGEVSKLYLLGGQFAIDAISVKLRKESAERLGLKHSPFNAAHIEIPAGFVQSVGDAVLLSVKLDDLQTLRPPNGARKERDHDPTTVDVSRS